MNILKRFRAWRDARALARAVRAEAVRDLSTLAVEKIRARGIKADARLTKPAAPASKIEPYKPPPGVLPAAEMAMDYDSTNYDYVNQMAYGSWVGGHFKGYPYLAMLAIQTEYRKMSEVLAEEATRKWIKLKSKGDEDKSDIIKKLYDAMAKFKIRDHFRTMALYDGQFGRGQLYIDLRTPRGTVASTDPAELKTLLLRTPQKITRGSLIGFKCVEPQWTFPGRYNSDNPLAADFYRPQAWYVMAREIHATRLITFISRPVPDMLKPSFNFGGLSLTQLAEPYVENWLRTRDSVSDLIHSFSLSGIMTDLSTILQDGGDVSQMDLRAGLYNEMRDNRGLLMLNKDSEEFFQHNVPLSGLDALQAQAQEQMATPASIPLVKFFGITPSGLNASSDGEIRVFYDGIKASQEADWRDPLTAVLEIIQLSEFGAVDPDVTFDFEPLWEADGTEMATIRKTDADTDAVLIAAGVITQDESRERLIGDEGSPYHSLESNPEAKDIAETLSEEEEARSAELLAKTQPPEAAAE